MMAVGLDAIAVLDQQAAEGVGGDAVTEVGQRLADHRHPLGGGEQARYPWPDCSATATMTSSNTPSARRTMSRWPIGDRVERPRVDRFPLHDAATCSTMRESKYNATAVFP